MTKHEDTQMNNMMAGIDEFSKNEKKKNAKKAKEKSNKSTTSKQNKLKDKDNHKSKSKKQYQNKAKSNTKTKRATKSSNTDYPWTSLLGVNETAVLFAIQHIFSCKSRTEALAELIKHNNLKITGQKKNDFDTLKRLFITENRPKAEKRYKKYFGKK